MIGLGGTGAKVIAATRRVMFQHHDAAEPPTVALDYLLIDTSKDETDVANVSKLLQENDRMWRVLGHTIQLDPGQIVFMPNSGLADIINKPDSYPRITNWLGDKAKWKKYWDNRPGEMMAAGQIRRVGRAVLAQNIDRVKDAINGRVKAAKSNINDWTFHVVAGLAGGTGSGSFLDVIAEIRKMAVGAKAKIILYVVLPEAGDTSWSTGNYHANGYAALAELNAVLVNKLELTDIANQRPTKTRKLGIDNVFVVTNENESRVRVNLTDELPTIIAETFYQLVVASGDARVRGLAGGAAGAGAEQRAWRDMITGENYDGNYERENDEDPESSFARANRFLGFGIKRISIPHQEVREYSSLVFLRQFLLQSLNNVWVEGQGFLDAKKPIDAANVAKSSDRRQAWSFTDGHLKLETPSLSNDSTAWRRIPEEFERAINAKATEIKKLVRDKADWPNHLSEFASDFYDQRFRQVGVAEFYRISEKSIQDRARYIVRDRVSKSLFEDWQKGALSIRDVERIVSELLEDCLDRDKKADDFIQKANVAETEAAKAIETKQSEYRSKMGIRGMLYDHAKSFTMLGQFYADRSAARAQRVAFDFMKKLLTAMHVHLLDLKADVETMITRFEETLEYIQPQIGALVSADDKNDANDHLFKLYDSRHVRTLLRRFEQNRKMQEDQSAALRMKVVELLGAQPSFSQFKSHINKGRLVAELEAVAEKHAASALSDVENPADRVLEASIVQKLNEEFGNRKEDLRRFLADRVNEARAFAPLNDGEMNKAGGVGVAREIVAFVPALHEQKENLRAFHGDLVGALRNAGATTNVTVIETSGQSEEIVILSLVNRFPLRALNCMPYLKEKYEKLLDGPTKENVPIHLSLEGSGIADLPSLFTQDPEYYREKAAPHLLLARSLDLLVERKNPVTHRKEVIYSFQDKSRNGELRVINVGSTMDDGTKSLGVSEALALIRGVEHMMSQVVNVDEKAEINAKLTGLRNEALHAAGLNESDPNFQQFEAVVKKARLLVGD